LDAYWGSEISAKAVTDCPRVRADFSGFVRIVEKHVAPWIRTALSSVGIFPLACQTSNTAFVFPKRPRRANRQQAFIRWKLPGTESASLQLGRFDFQDGNEVTPKNPTLALLKRDRIRQRLIGPFTFTHVMRSFDGFHFVYNHPRSNYTLIGAAPTRGVFQTDGWGWMKVAFAYASAASELRVFAIYYDDWRHIVKADNRPVAVKAASELMVRTTCRSPRRPRCTRRVGRFCSAKWRGGVRRRSAQVWWTWKPVSNRKFCGD
jgi:hypothetical protein